MPIDNEFRHQSYTDLAPQAPYGVYPAISVDRADSLDDRARDCLRQSQLRKVLLVHGTFTGDDALGLARTLDRVIPKQSEYWRQLNRDWVDQWIGDVGNFTADYVERFQTLVEAADADIAIDRLTWSGENHHVGRADAAVLLLDHLLQEVRSGCDRFLLWGHSHAGNVFALATNLLRGPTPAVRRFFAASHLLFGSHQISPAVRERWRRVRRSLLKGDTSVDKIRLDIVTFGTPIRYGWETGGYGKLLHVVHHRPPPQLPVYRTMFPFDWDDLRTARYGDYVQQLGIAGTDFLPSVFTWRAYRVESRLNRLLQPGLYRSGTWDRLKCGMRVAQEGETLLVEYPDDAAHCRTALFGHGVYTNVDWLPFHLREVLLRFYG